MDFNSKPYCLMYDTTCLYFQDEVGSPGLIISVSVDGKEVWSEGNYNGCGFCPLQLV